MARNPVHTLIVCAALGMFTLTAVPKTEAQGIRARVYRVDPQIRKKTAREYLLKSLELNARVETMIMQGSNSAAMLPLLDKSYALSAQAINQMEGIVREARWPEPMMERAIREMYTSGKPCSLQAQAKLKSNKPEEAIHDLQEGMVTQRRVLQMLY